MSGRFAGERALVIGAGIAGVGAARILLAEGADVRVSESRPEHEVAAAAELRELGIELRCGGHAPEHLDGRSLVVTSPGVPPTASVLAWARKRGLPIWGELELGARLAEAPLIGVTGTNGKTTTTSMITACLRSGGVDAVACGNIGRPFPEAARQGHQALVVECSSFQLANQTSFRPRVSVLLNLAPDHLDWHGSFERYAAAKARIFAGQGTEDVHIGNADDPEAARISARAPCPVLWFRSSAPGEGEVGYDRDELVVRIDGEVRIPAVADRRPSVRSDAAAAAAASLAFGASIDAVAAGLAGFTPDAHRGELVAVVAGVRFVDDSKATNVHAALAAIDGARDPVLIAGGRAKGVDLTPLVSRAARLRAVVAIGEAGPELAELFHALVPTRRAASIEEATAIALELAAEEGTVLLAPACASWDQFADYAERGDRFAAAARGLERVQAGG